MLDVTIFSDYIGLVFLYLDSKISLEEAEKRAEQQQFGFGFVKGLSKISSNKTVIYKGKKYIWQDLNKLVREKVHEDHVKAIVSIAIRYLDGDYSLEELAAADDVSFSSSSLQRHFNTMIPEASEITYHGISYTGESFYELLQNKMKSQKQAGKKKGGKASALKTYAMRNETGQYQGNIRLEELPKYVRELDRYERSVFEGKLFLDRHSSTRLVGKIVKFSNKTIYQDLTTTLKDKNPIMYQKIAEQMIENKDMGFGDDGNFIDAEEKHRRKK